MKKKTTALIILDGFGDRPAAADNAITTAGTPNIVQLKAEYPHTTIVPFGLAVGLPEGQMGNSEVGHTNIGAGRIVYQELTRISKAITDGSFDTRPALQNAMAHLKATGGSLQCMGLLSDGGVHSHIEHLMALVDLAHKNGIRQTYIHAFMDGRDVPPTSGVDYVRNLQAALADRGYGRLATVMGRYYAMDRDNRFDRVEKAWAAMVHGEGQAADDAVAAIEQSYADGVNDEFIVPIVLHDQGRPVTQIADGDAVICFNFRPDRAREITRAFIQPEFNGFDRRRVPQVFYASMTQYDETFTNLQVVFPPEGRLKNTLGEWLATQNKTQLRIAETEKYAHVTFFFNGGAEERFEGEDRILVPSPKVATYDLQPEMSAPEVTRQALQVIEQGLYDCMILNFANPDMVGHTGVMDAAVAAIRTVDDCTGQLVRAILQNGGQCLITADHGNAEQMMDVENDLPYTAHTVDRPVPCILVSPELKHCTLRSDGVLADLAPTLLDMMGLPKPAEMTGHSLIVK